ncbi:hypothetical protein [Nocardiopsis metallicus]|uniref:Uncharacterized protein n=1 Tax=Nocardiopsis metallicus TaxID=179819 RepID=A0A840W0R5_9ACTN|nr:hypothetical protein [Nocardiopsis metallicus]MBB5489564.1 hypothetical protein [Nocardiopsis metallicus]
MTRSPAHSGALQALGSLLDGSVAQIAEAAESPCDYPALRRNADVWDNNTLTLFRAAVAPTVRSREGRARAALAWMAALGPDRRAWMTERARERGFTLADLVEGKPVVGKPVVGRLGPEAGAAAQLLIGAMLRIRSVRPEPGQPELVRALARALDGAGTDILAVGAHRGHWARERAFRALGEEWVRRGGPLSAPVFARVLKRLGRLEPAPATKHRGG